MNEERLEAYANLIDQLLACASDKEAWQILDANRDLVNAGLTQTMLEVAEDLREGGDLYKSNFLMNIVEELMGVHGNTSDPQMDFLMQVLQVTAESGGDAQKVYPLLEANIDKLDARLAELLQALATSKLADAKPDEAEYIATDIGNFSNLIQQFPLGNKASNMEIAINGYEIALTVFTHDAFPQEWAATQNNLGTVYRDRILGERAENLEVAIACFQNALKIRTFKASPQEWAQTQDNLATVYTNRIREKRAENLEVAIACCQDALKVYTFEAFPQEWAGTKNNLATAYINRIREKRAENLEVAIACCQDALKVYTFEAFPQEWAGTQNNLAIAYFERIRGQEAENLEEAIACYQKALKVYTFEAFPYKWAAMQNNLANAYGKRILGRRTENLEEAITCYQKALEVRTFEAFPVDWADTQYNLATTYRNRILGERAENLEVAIACCQDALKVYTFEAFPDGWADMQQNLGLAYRDRILGERAENLEWAIACFQDALKVYTFEAFPDEWADTEENLGTAYSDRILGERAENLELAIACFQDALKVYTFEAFPYEWARTQYNLAIAYRYRIREDKAENLEEAIACCQDALKVYTFEAFPDGWADTQSNLGLVYRDRILGERAENLEVAIACFQNALKIRTFEAFPVYWAYTQHNLATAYLQSIREERAENLERAIACFQDALKIRTFDASPKNHAETLWGLGVAYQQTNQFNLAFNIFESAISTIESLREDIISGEESKRKQAEEFNAVYSRMVEVCCQLSNITEAIEYVERSKTRNLVEQIFKRDQKTIFPPKVVTQLEQYRDEIATGQYQIQHRKAENPKVLAQHLRELRQKRNELQNCYLPIGSGFQFEHFQNKLDDRTAIVEFYISGDKFLSFIFTHLTQQPRVWQSESKDLDKLIKWLQGYLIAYYIKKSHWQRRLTTRLRLLAQILHIDEIIQQIPSECDRLILIPHQYLHLFPLHALPINSQQGEETSEILMHRFPAGVSYAPSCQLLELAQTRKRTDFTSLFAVQNPTDDLDYTNLEVEAIKSFFQTAEVLASQDASEAAVKVNQNLTTAHCSHFSCHGYFQPESPLESALVLAETKTRQLAYDKTIEDGFLTLGEIFGFNLNQCRLVTLSACETGLIDFTNISDEYIGLPSGFLVAGTSAVVSSLWTVNDLSTAFLMIKFYENFRNQMSLALALNHAQLWLRDATKKGLQKWVKKLPLDSTKKGQIRRQINKMTGEKPFNSPYHWAAFTAVGK
jgi:CHAT domain-containing protein